ncbi:MAG TPA: beta-1,6-N-acetylglucosaminyltransferase [Candidatus Babeliales bacterium]|nr:beta-1,6-N-acetylglucosaminyltransferase [Candidatus Babeliales bacterium]
MLKIAFLFLTIADVYHQDHWKDFFAGHEDAHSLYAHSKEHLKTGDFLKPYEMTYKIDTTWANTMRAQIELLRVALQDSENTKFIFISESTIPLQNFDTVYARIMSDEKSMFYFVSSPYVGNTWGPRNLQPIPQDKQYKNSQWVVLNRKHAQLMVDDRYYIDIITRYPCDQEHYPSTLLINCGLIDEIIRVSTTYVEWGVKAEKYPYHFTDLRDPSELSMLINAQRLGFLFARKITEKCDLTLLNRYLPYRWEYQT